MAFEVTTVNNIVGDMSPHHLSLALNSGGLFFATPATGAEVIAVIKCPIPQQQLKIIVRADDAFGAGETLVMSARYVNANGDDVVATISTLNSTNIPAAGEFESVVVSVPDLLPGAVVQLVHVYVAGGTPNAPVLSYIAQFS